MKNYKNMLTMFKKTLDKTLVLYDNDSTVAVGIIYRGNTGGYFI